MRYIITRVPGVENAWHCIDSLTGVSVTWTEGRFNDAQSAAWPDDLAVMADTPARLAHTMRLMADWLAEHHGDLL